MSDTHSSKADVADLYDRLAGIYHQYHPDYRAAMQKQGADLAALIRRLAPEAGPALLDCSCGIGIQALGLAGQGFDVTGTDISPGSIARATDEAAAMGLPARFAVADMCKLDALAGGPFDVVISCGNSLAHLTRDEDLAAALAAIRGQLKPGGLFLAAIRDYRELVKTRPSIGDHGVYRHGDTEVAYIQAWAWVKDGSRYRCDDYTIFRTGAALDTRHVTAWFRPLLPDDLATRLMAAGFAKTGLHLPAETGHHNPIISARA